MHLRILILIVVACALHHAYADSETARLAVARLPDHMEIEQDPSGSKLTFDDFKRLLASTLGFSIDRAVAWKGLRNKSPVTFSNAVMIFLGNSKTVDMDEFSTTSFSIDQQSKNIDLNSFDSLESLDDFNSKVLKFESLETPEKFPSDCRTQMNPEVYVFNIADSKKMAHDIDSIISKYRKECDSDPLALLLTHDKVDELTRVKRQINKETVKNTTSKIDNPAPVYGRYYPAMFNLFFWTSLVLGLALFAIGYGMWNMDPGVDTVIYRMTSQRIKKDQ